MTRSRPRLPLGPALVAAAVLLGALAGGSPAAAQDPDPPVVQVSTVIGLEAGIYVDCDGTERVFSEQEAALIVVRTGDAADELVVPVSLSGTLAGTVVDPPSSVTLAAGETSAVIVLRVDAYQEGTLRLTLEDGPDHEVGDPDTAVLDAGPPELWADCATPLVVDPVEVAVGGRPDRIDLLALCIQAYPDYEALLILADRCAFAGVSTFEALDALPPGLELDARGEWSGAATEPGRHEVEVRLCMPGTYLGVEQPPPPGGGEPPLVDVCVGTLVLDITVTAGGSGGPGGPSAPPASPTSASPATPISGPARFTG